MQLKTPGPSQNLYKTPKTAGAIAPYYSVMSSSNRRLTGWAAATAAVAFGAIQLVPVPGKTNPPVDSWQTIGAHVAVPPEVQAIFQRACRNCHSNETVWPWYGRVAPGSWLVARDVTKARKAMNWSTWAVGAGKSPAVGAATLAAACADVRSGRMPLPQYQVMHPESRLTKTDQDRFCNWANRASDHLLSEQSARRKLEARIHLGE